PAPATLSMPSSTWSAIFSARPAVRPTTPKAYGRSSGNARRSSPDGRLELMADDALTLAQRCAEAMWANDRASRGLGMEIVDIGPGRSTLTMTIRETMTNGQGICHGGFIFALADSAFAFACNGYDQR